MSDDSMTAFERRLARGLRAYADERIQPVQPRAMAEGVLSGPARIGTVAPFRPRGLSASARLVLVAATLVVTLVGAALLSGGFSPQRPGPSSPDRSTASPRTSVAAVLPTASPDLSGPCYAGRAVFSPGHLLDSGVNPLFRAPLGLQIAATIDTADGGMLLRGGGAAAGMGVLARWTGSEQQLAILDVAADASELLLWYGHFSPSIAERNCGDLALVATDGSGVRVVTHYPPLSINNAAALAPDGSKIAAIGRRFGDPGDGTTLDLVDTDGRVEWSEPCTGGPSETLPVADQVGFSPDSRRLVRLCGSDLAVITVADGPSSRRPYQSPQGAPLAVRWSADGLDLLVATVDPGEGPGRLRLYRVDVASGRWTQEARTSFVATWVSCCPAPIISPDGRFVIAADGSADPETTVVLDSVLATTTRLPTILGWSSTNPLIFAADGRTVLTGQGLEAGTGYGLREQDLVALGAPTPAGQLSATTWFGWSPP